MDRSALCITYSYCSRIMLIRNQIVRERYKGNSYFILCGQRLSDPMHRILGMSESGNDYLSLKRKRKPVILNTGIITTIYIFPIKCQKKFEISVGSVKIVLQGSQNKSSVHSTRSSNHSMINDSLNDTFFSLFSTSVHQLLADMKKYIFQKMRQNESAHQYFQTFLRLKNILMYTYFLRMMHIILLLRFYEN